MDPVNEPARMDLPTSDSEPNLILDDGDGDFGDFQTFADSTDDSSSTVPTLDSASTYTASSSTANSATTSSISSPAHMSHSVAKFPNIYELDMFAFQEFVTNFEEQLLQMFVPVDASLPLKSAADVNSSMFANTSPGTLFAFNDEAAVTTANHNNATNNGPTSPIHSQEDIINDCPIWYNLTGSYNCKPPLNFLKSDTFKRYVHSLNAAQSDQQAKPKKKLIKARKSPSRILTDLPANMKCRLKLITQQDFNDLNETLDAGDFEEDEVLYEERVRQNRDVLFDEEELANDLDMHSLIVGQSGTGTNGTKDPMVASADEIIEEIETIMDSRDNKKTSVFGQPSQPLPDPMLSLNASSLLDAAMQSWQVYQDTDEDDAAGYHSLPANLNSDEPESLQPQLPKHQHNLTRLSSDGQSVGAASQPNPSPSIIDKLSRLSIVQLNELYMELEQIIQMRSEVLIHELAMRDELEFEKEQKNQFISLLLSVQNKRRYYTANGGSPRARPKQKPNSSKHGLTRRKSDHGSSMVAVETSSTSRLMSRARLDLSSLGSSLRESFRFSGTSNGPSNPVYLTTVIPYRSEMNVDTPTLQMLIKLLKAMDEDSSTVPSLLTDYILKVICP